MVGKQISEKRLRALQDEAINRASAFRRGAPQEPKNDYGSRPDSPEIKEGPRGGRYTEDRTSDGRPYRRYF